MAPKISFKMTASPTVQPSPGSIVLPILDREAATFAEAARLVYLALLDGEFAWLAQYASEYYKQLADPDPPQA